MIQELSHLLYPNTLLAPYITPLQNALVVMAKKEISVWYAQLENTVQKMMNQKPASHVHLGAPQQLLEP